MKKLVSLLIVLLFIIPISLAVGTLRYPNSGGVDQDYSNEGRGEFILIGGEFDFNQFAKNLDSSLGTPIIDDLDNNSISELIIVDDDVVKVFQNKELDIISSVDIGDSPSDISNILSFDIDGDGFNEIIFLGVDTDFTKDEMFILNFTQADGIQIQNRFSVLTISNDVSDPMIACRDANECITTVRSRFTEDEFNPFTARHEGFPFDSSNLTGGIFTIFSQTQGASDGIALCSPRDKNIIVNDYDGDGNIEYILSMGLKEDSGGSTVEWKTFWLDNITIEQTGSESESVSELTVACDGLTGLTNSFTSPIVAELFSGEPKKEACIGAQSSNDDFRIFCFSGSDGSVVDEFPEEFSFLEADGTIVSNVVFGNFIPDSNGVNDVCVMGFDSTELRYELLCGSDKRTGVIFSHIIYDFPFSSLAFNISILTTEQHHLIHGVQFSDALTDSVDLQEILTTYGVFEIDFTPADLNRIFDPSTTRGVNLGIDLEQFGQDDIISMTDTNIFYFDDKGSNNPAEIIEITYNPCPVNTLIKVNTTMQVTVEARDTNTFALGFDDLTFSTFAYFSDANQQNRTLPNISTSQVDGSATVIYAPLFDMNKTITNGIIRTEVFDVANPTEIDIEEQLFSVAQQGLEFGDATCTVEIIIPPEEVEVGVLNISTDATANVGITNFFEGASNEFKVSPLIIVLFLMLAWTIAVLTTADKMNDSMISMNKVIFMLIGNAFIFIIAAVVGAISFGVLLVFIILFIFSIVIWARRQFTANVT